MILVGIAQARENFSIHPEIGMVHMRTFRGLRHAQSDTAEFGGGHETGTSVEKDIIELPSG